MWSTKPDGLHPVLRRQLRRLSLSPEVAPDLAGWQAIVQRISHAYREADDDRYTQERSLEISSREMQGIYDALRSSSEVVQRRQMAILRATLEASPDGTLVLGPGYEVIGFNQRFVTMWAVPAAMLTPLDGEAIFQHVIGTLADPQWLLRRRAFLMANPDRPSHEEVGLGDGRTFEVHSVPVDFGADEGHGRVFFFRDITERLAHQNELSRAKEAAEQAARAKTLFLTNMSHELRTPLNAIVGFGRVLQRTIVDRPGREGEYVSVLVQSAEHMLQLVNDLLDLREVEVGAGRFDLIDLELGPLLERAAGLVAPMLRERQQAVHTTLEPAAALACANARAVVQILVNLLSNAAKYSPPGSSIEVRVRRREERVEVAVEDHGQGIRPEDLGRLFTYYERLGARHDHHMQGSGVGLALTRALVGGLGGEISVRSTPGAGSTFAFTLRPASSGGAPP